MTALHTAVHAASRDIAWRSALLRAAGLPEELARAIATSDEYDLNSLVGLLDRGCPAATALRITGGRGREALSA